MKPAVLLIDLQEDFLRDARLEPHADRIVDRAACLLRAARGVQAPVLHVHTLVDSIHDAMPHWQATGHLLCVRGTPGSLPPPALQPSTDETVLPKVFFSAFSNPSLLETLHARAVDVLIIAGVHSHSCVRATAIDAYQYGFKVIIAGDAIGSYDPLHGELTRSYLQGRAVQFLDVAEVAPLLNDVSRGPGAFFTPTRIELVEPGCRTRKIGTVALSRSERVSAAVDAARSAFSAWRQTSLEHRNGLFRQLEQRLASEAALLATQLVRDVGKPISAARGEVLFARQLLTAALSWRQSQTDHPSGIDWTVRSQPHGVVALVTPWNNPLAIPLGKIVPALLHGNSVVWKPAPAGTLIAERLEALICAVGFPPGLVEIVSGDRETAELLMGCDGVEAVSITGSAMAGYTAGAICGRRHIPLQAELGGNNAAIVLEDAPLKQTAHAIAVGAMGFAGQRCTANRRVIVPAPLLEEWVDALREAIARLNWGDPRDETTIIGPMISDTACNAVAALVRRAGAHGARVLQTHPDGQLQELAEVGFYQAPALVVATDPGCEIVQEETFGPVLVVQPARDWEQALSLCNGVRQGLVASLFTGAAQRQHDFFARCHAGMLKINAATASVSAEPPFCAWKGSGIGPPEHGAGDAMFYTRLQTIYP